MSQNQKTAKLLNNIIEAIMNLDVDGLNYSITHDRRRDQISVQISDYYFFTLRLDTENNEDKEYKKFCEYLYERKLIKRPEIIPKLDKYI